MPDFSDPANALAMITRPLTQLTPVRENWIILYRGKPIALRTNGKWRWNKRNHALCALTNAFETALHYSGTRPSHDQHKEWLENFKVWRKTNIQLVQQEEFEKEKKTP